MVLGYSKPLDAIQRHVEEDDSVKHGLIDAIGRKQQTILINESGLYSLILSSKAIIVHVDDEDKTVTMMEAHSQNGNLSQAKTTLINESGLYFLCKALLIYKRNLDRRRELMP